MHRAESIMQAVETTVTGLTTTGSNVHRGRVYALAAVPALTVSMGADEVREDLRDLSSLVRELEIIITAHDQQTGQLETRLNQIKTEVFAALMADITQGLNYIIQTDLVGDDAPELEAEQDQPTARCDMRWRIYYRHSGTTTEA